MPSAPLDLTVFADPRSGEPLDPGPDGLYAPDGSREAQLIDGVAEFVSDETQDHFGLQWNHFAAVQLDSFNGTTQSRDRLLEQSGLTPADFAGKTVLEVGCGAGRFTEVLLQFGAKVVAVDYSAAVYANRRTHDAAAADGRVLFARTDVFDLPFRPRSFDIVLCYGVVQHTGNARRAVTCLWEMVAPGGILLVDRYRASPKNQILFKHLLRPATKRMSSQALLSATDRIVSRIFPWQVRTFASLQGGGVRRIARLALIRLMPNSVFPLNLHVQGDLDREVARTWSILDTFDMYGPRYDLPQTFRAWRRDLQQLEAGAIERCAVCGQGNTATVRRSVSETATDKAGKQFWDELWEEVELPEPIDPRSTRLGNLFNRRMHQLFERVFGAMATEGRTLLEVGCGRSAWLPYFHKEFGFSVSGLDYSEIGCDQERRILATSDVEGDIVCADLFSPPSSMLESYDAVWSLGVVEHFADTAGCIEACAALLKPGGTMITLIPNLTGTPGLLQRRLDRSIYDVHVPLTAAELERAHQAVGLTVVECRYFLSTGFGVLRAGDGSNPTLANRMKRRVIRLLEGGSAGLWWLEDRTSPLPASGLFAPFVYCVAEKR
jgi:2-polyprenyl-3-methyl-5-hydroxy-6-metoxy-1,4-benzoquinol methylase